MIKLLKQNPQNELASGLPLFICGLLLTSILLLVCVDFFGVWVLRNSYVNNLGQLRQELMQSHVSLQFKNSNNMQADIAKYICSYLRSEGFNGQIKVWCLSDPDFSDNSKVITVWCVQISSKFLSLSQSPISLDGTIVAADASGTYLAYSHKNTYKPINCTLANGLYTFNNNSNAYNFKSISLIEGSKYPPGLIRYKNQLIQEFSYQ